MGMVKLQCEDCHFGGSLAWGAFDDSLTGKLFCSEYVEEIPSFVEEATQDCPKFKPKVGS